MKNFDVAVIADAIFKEMPDATLMLENETVFAVYSPEDLDLALPLTVHVDGSRVIIYRSRNILKEIHELDSEFEVAKQIIPLIESLSKTLSIVW